MLEQLIKEQIDPNPTLRKQLVSADLLGGNVLVPKGKTVGGDFKNVPTCQVRWPDALRRGLLVLPERTAGRRELRTGEQPAARRHAPTEEEIKNLQVVCVNPAAFSSTGNPPDRCSAYESTSPFPGLLGSFVKAPKASDPMGDLPGAVHRPVQAGQRRHLVAADRRRSPPG